MAKIPTMAFVVARPGERFEIRESLTTDRGPRSRTLASFSVLDPVVLKKAQGRAIGPIDVDVIVRKARALGATVAMECWT